MTDTLLKCADADAEDAAAIFVVLCWVWEEVRTAPRRDLFIHKGKKKRKKVKKRLERSD